jgi:hypothetical protein
MLKYEPDDTSEATILIADAVTDSEKQLVGMGTKILIWPDKKQFDTASGELRELEMSWQFEPDGSMVTFKVETILANAKNVEKTYPSGVMTFTPCDENGTTYLGVEYGTTLPTNSLYDGRLFLLVQDENYPNAGKNVLEQYSTTTRGWTDIPLEYCRIYAKGIGEKIKRSDSVQFENLPSALEQILSDPLASYFEIQDSGDDYLVIKITPNTESIRFYCKIVQCVGVTINFDTEKAAIETFYFASGYDHNTNSWTPDADAIAAKNCRFVMLNDGTWGLWEISGDSGYTTIERQVPDLDYITVCDNRVWGCSSTENVLYACKLGNPASWYSYQGIASDSYAVTVGSDGAFTGAASCRSYVLFFKENTLHKVYGTKPSDFQVSTLPCRGVAKNAAKSLCVINEALYYLSAEGVMMWEGSLPGKISSALDPDKLANAARAVAGSLDGRYYLQIETDAEKRLLVYDTERGIWNEENVAGTEMVSTGRQLYLWDGEGLWAVLPTREKDYETADAAQTESTLAYEWISGDIGLDNPDDKYISRITVRMDAEARSTVHIYASYDGEPWEQLGEATTSTTKARLDVPIVPARHDTMRLRIQGTGRVTLRSVAFTFAGSRGKIVQGTK